VVHFMSVAEHSPLNIEDDQKRFQDIRRSCSDSGLVILESVSYNVIAIITWSDYGHVTRGGPDLVLPECKARASPCTCVCYTG
jgi:hypothetical protein